MPADQVLISTIPTKSSSETCWLTKFIMTTRKLGGRLKTNSSVLQRSVDQTHSRVLALVVVMGPSMSPKMGLMVMVYWAPGWRPWIM